VRGSDSSSDDSSSEGLSSEYETDDASTTSERSKISARESSIEDEVGDIQGHGNDSDDSEVAEVSESLDVHEMSVGNGGQERGDGSHDDNTEEEVPEQLDVQGKEEGTEISEHERRLSSRNRSDSPPISEITHETSEGECNIDIEREEKGNNEGNVVPVDDNSVLTDDMRESSDKKAEPLHREDDGKANSEEEVTTSVLRDSEDVTDVNKSIQGGGDVDKKESNDSGSIKLDQNFDSESEVNASIVENSDTSVIKDDVVKEEPPVQTEPKKSSRWGWGKKK